MKMKITKDYCQTQPRISLIYSFTFTILLKYTALRLEPGFFLQITPLVLAMDYRS